MAKRTDLLIIDPQWDFCNPGTALDDPDRGALYVPGAEADMSRLAGVVRRYGDKVDKIHVTLDSHYLIDVAHPGMWRDSRGNHPKPFTLITSQDIKDGKWVPVFVQLRTQLTDYAAALEAGGKYLLIIWPPHCLIGSKGGMVMPDLMQALIEWQLKHSQNVDFVSKGSNPLTEHYSGIKAEVPIPSDPSTQLNVRLIETLKQTEEFLFAGEALSHCLKSTGDDIADGFGDDSYLKKMVLLTDATSPVPSAPGTPDFPAIGAQWIKDMKARGMRTAICADF
jgi:nicotinamidase/pyrazinamidase